MKEQLRYVDGLKGICGIWIILFHYLLAFAIFGYVGFECGVADVDKYDYYFQYFPYSIISNSSCALYIFFAIIAFLPAQHHFRNRDEGWIKRQAVVRYFRLMPPILLIAVLTYFVYTMGGFYNQELSIILNNTWDKYYFSGGLSLTGALTEGLYGAIWQGSAAYNVVFWCMQIIFFGSYMAYAILLFFGHLRRRFYVYFACFFLAFIEPFYLIFLAGIVAADILVSLEKQNKQKQHIEIKVCILLIFALIIMHIPQVLYPWPLLESIAFALGSGGILIACGLSPCIQRILSHPFLVSCGKYSFSMVLVHFSVMCSFSSWLFLAVHDQVGYVAALALTFITAIPVNAIAVIAFQKCTAKPTAMLSKAVYGFLK